MDLPLYMRIEHQFSKICFEIGQNAIVLDVDKCYKFIKILNNMLLDIDKELVPKMPTISKQLPPLKSKNAIQKWIQSGKPYKFINNNLLGRWDVEKPNPNSADQLRELLLQIGWKPSDDFEAWNYKQIKNSYGKLEKVKGKDNKFIKTTPKLPNEDSELEHLSKKSPLFSLVSKRVQIKHRISTLEGYIKNINIDGRIRMGINSCGCNTMRVRHNTVANVPRIGSFFGAELRAVFTVPVDKVMVGADIAGLEACILAHYLGDKDFIDFIIKEDFKYHKFFYNLLKDYVSSYDICKGLDFAFIFGGGDYKLGTLCDLKKNENPSKVGAEVRELMLKNIPGLEKLTKELENQYELLGGIIGLDGRLIKVRKKSALINTACQSGGAIIAKVWTCRAQQLIKGKPVIFYHDELAYETKESIAKEIGDTLVQAIKWSGEFLKLKIPLTGSYKIGKTWGDIH